MLLRNSRNTRPEDRFIVRLLRDLTNPKSGADRARWISEQRKDLDWSYLTHKMSEEGVSFLVFYYLEKLHLQDLLPAGTYKSLSEQYYANVKRNMLAGVSLRTVFDRFNEQGIPFIVLKGIALAERVYPGFATRGMSDADILIRKDDVYRADRCLAELGYVAADSLVTQALSNPAGYLASLDYHKSDGSFPNIHIHWHPVNTSVPAFMFAGQIDLDRLWGMAIHATIANAKTLILCPEHEVIYLCEHALRINHSFDRIVLIYDIFYAIRKSEIRWDFLAEEARRFNVSKLVFLSLAVVRHYTSLTIPEEMMQHLHSSDLTFGENYFLNLQLKNQRFRGSSILVYLSMNKGLLEKSRFLFRTFFPPRHILSQRQYAKNREFKAFDYILRFREIVSHLVKISLHRTGNS